MEEKKLDLNSIIGFVLISGLLIWMLYSNAPTPEELEAEKAKKEQVEKAKEEEPAKIVSLQLQLKL
jgi:YidC/Oxa1 family membrane protein insertase